MNESTVAASVSNPAVAEPKGSGSWAPAQRFHFLGHEFDQARGELQLHYRLEPGVRLCERFYFPLDQFADEEMLNSPAVQQALNALFDALHWVAAVSYWKTSCPRELVFHQRSPDAWQADFLTRLYRQGLAEFAHVNNVDLTSRIDFSTYAADYPFSAQSIELPAQALVPMGGGKDSLVVLEHMRQHLPVRCCVVGQAKLIDDVAANTGVPLVRVRRQLAPELKALNEAGAWNGHIPITAINSIVLSILALLTGHRYLVFANERSADTATRITGEGAGVNHQYSKSFVFERDWQHFLQHYVGGVQCFSLLRPWRELAVCQAFARLERYHEVFSSCNRNFHLTGSKLSGQGAAARWCGVCPKCHFVFLALAPFMAPAALATIFGNDLLADSSHTDAYAALLGLAGKRPFECIGEVAECRAALSALAHDQQWQQHAVVQALWPKLAALQMVHPEPDLAQLLAPHPEHAIPAAFAGPLLATT
ncbi:MAG: endonuclease domain-containing protein [Xanthomonadales bacterium]|nr:endonuclease domain-containing protein [Xanthomonadales bacterium]